MENSRWPEPQQFIDIPSLKLRCAETVLEALFLAGRADEQLYNGELFEISRTIDLISPHFREERYVDTLRIVECLYTQVLSTDEHGMSISAPFDDAYLPARMFVLKHGILDAALSPSSEDTEWSPMACIVIDTAGRSILDGESVTLLDAMDGRELDLGDTIHLLGFLEAICQHQRSIMYETRELYSGVSMPSRITEIQ